MAKIRLKTSSILMVVGTAVIYIFYLYGLSSNPPGFFLDESCLAYNAYLIAQSGTSEFGHPFPLFFQCYAEGFVQYANPTHVYLLAIPFLLFEPGVLTVRIFAATVVFVGCLLLGVLSARASGRRGVGVVVALTAIVTPWVFEVSRLVLEVFFYPLAVGLFLFCLYRAQARDKWKLADNLMLAATLALLTYSYTIGRLLGPLLALGLILFAVNKTALWAVVKTWLLYGLSLVPLAYVYFTTPEILVKRFGEVSYIFADKPFWQIAVEFLGNYIDDIGLRFLLLDGDPNLRHHVPGMGEILIPTLILAVGGIILILVRHRNDSWWRYILYGLFASVVPAALTADRHHTLRLVAFPIFLLLITVPAIKWLLDGKELLRRAALIILLAMTLEQAVLFQYQFRSLGPYRGDFFDERYPRILDEALATGERPIYLEDGYYGPAYIHAYWHGAIKGIDRSNFIHLAYRQPPPAGALVISSDQDCSNCEIISRQGSFILYRAGPDIGLAR